MRLDIDCVRDVLMAVEQKGFGQSYTISNLHDLLDYSSDQIEYTCLKLSEAGYLDITTVQMTQKTTPGIYSVNELTFQGHEFLSNISSQKVFDKTKKICQGLGSASLEVVAQVASNVISSLINPKMFF